MSAGGGCKALARAAAGGWVADYDTAERRVRDTDRELLIYYRGTQRGHSDRTGESLRDRSVKRSISRYVCCRLFKSYEPDRRYVAQFGVMRAPALILVHRDGTYHARTGPMDTERMIAFLADSQAPGAMPAPNPYLPRDVVYHWQQNPRRVQEEAEARSTPILYVFHRGLSRDWRMLEKLFDRSEVHSRFAKMSHCRLNSWSPGARRLAEELGVTHWPAVVVVEGDGSSYVLERPTCYEQIVRFADNRTDGRDSSQSATAAATVPATAMPEG